MTFVEILPLFIAFFTSALILRFLIPFFRKKSGSDREKNLNHIRIRRELLQWEE